MTDLGTHHSVGQLTERRDQLRPVSGLAPAEIVGDLMQTTSVDIRGVVFEQFISDEWGVVTDRWLTVLSGGRSSAPPHFLPELGWFDSPEDLEAQGGIMPGTPVIIDLARIRTEPERYRTERVFTEFLRTSRWSRLKQGTRTT